MKNSLRASAYPRDVVRAMACLGVAFLLTAAAVAQESVRAPADRTAAAPVREPVPTTIPHTQPASKPQAGPKAKSQLGAATKPTVVLKPGEVPAISFEQPTWEFGRVKAGDDLTHEFAFTNTGTGPLEILEVRPG